jgi:hypothetical protein
MTMYNVANESPGRSRHYGYPSHYCNPMRSGCFDGF